MSQPFTVLMVCMGNICRSPMAERLLVLRLRDEVGPVADQLVRVHGAGTTGWHAGDAMDAAAAREVRARGGDPTGFLARHLARDMLTGPDAADLVLTATIEQVEEVTDLVPEAAARTFVLGEFARLAAAVDPADLPPAGPTVEAVAARGRALVVAADKVRDGARYADQVPDPWGRAPEYFTAVADQIDTAVTALAAQLTG